MIILKRKFRKSEVCSSLSEAVKMAGKKRCTLIIEGTTVVTTDITIPKNIKLRKLPGCFLHVGKGGEIRYQGGMNGNNR